MKRFLFLGIISCLLFVASNVFAQTSFEKVTSAEQLVAGGKYIIVGETDNVFYALGGQKTSNRAGNTITVENGVATVNEATANSTSPVDGEAIFLELGTGVTNSEYFTFKDAVNGGYLYAGAADGNKLLVQNALTVDGEWNITFDGGNCSIVAAGSANRNVMQFNKGTNKLFSCYVRAATNNDVLPVSIYVDPNSVSSDPAISIVSPANGTYFYGNTTFLLNASVRNFVLGTDGKIQVDCAGLVSWTTSTEIPIGTLVEGENVITLSLTDMEQNEIASIPSVNITVYADSDYSTLMAISEIQGTEDVAAENGNIVATRGVVTAKTNYGFYIQDLSGDDFSGLYVYAPSYLETVNVADEVVVKGKIEEYSGLTEMKDLSVCQVLLIGAEMPAVVEVALSDLDEKYESRLIKVTGQHNGTLLGGAWQLSNNGTIYVGQDCFTNAPMTGIENYEVTGVLSFSNKENYNVGWVVLPRNANDITPIIDGALLTVSNPTEGQTILDDNVTVEFRVFNFVLGTDGKLKYTLNGGEAQYVTSDEPFVVNNLADGENTLSLTLVQMDGSELAEAYTPININFLARTSGSLAIRDIQYTTASDDASTYVGQTVTLTGTVTKIKSNNNGQQGFYIQDAEAEWSGLYIYDRNNIVALNDKVTVTGAISEYNGLTEMTPTQVQNAGQVAAVNPVSVLASQVNEPYESVLVKVEGVCTGTVSANKWKLTGDTEIEVYGLAFTPEEGRNYIVTGIAELNSYNGANTWQVLPRDANDIVSGSVTPAITITNPANGSTIYQAAVVAQVSVFNFEVGGSKQISFAIDEQTAVAGTETSHTFTGLSDGNHTITAKLIDGENEVASTQVSFTVNLAGPTFTAIRDIQFTEDASGDSPLKNQTVWVKGVVTSNFLNTPYQPLKGYSIQDEVAAWSGVWVFDSINNPNIGDSVKFQAQVTEYYGLTELKNVANFEIFDMGSVRAIDVVVNEANSEAYEGCFVRVECVRSLGSTMSYGNWECVNEAGDTVRYSHNFDRDAFQCETDMTYSVEGVVEYSYSKWYVNYPAVSNITADCSMSVEDEIANMVEVYPNPSTGVINVANADGQTISVVNMLGQVICEYENASSNQVIDLSQLGNGTYFVRVDTRVVKVSIIK